jgi:starch synthase
VVFASAELAPLAQTGGLGEAVAGLASALSARGHQLVCLLPAHRGTASHPEFRDPTAAGPARVDLPDGPRSGRWLAGRLGSLEVQLLELDGLYDRDSLYDGADAAIRFAAFSRACAARTAALLPDVLVVHDWHAALAVCALRTLHDMGPRRGIGAVQVVHNGAHQGSFPAEIMPFTGLPVDLFVPDGLEFHGSVSLLKGGLAWADRIAAVSPQYAEELKTPEFGAGLDGLYRLRAHRLVGIANGIDAERWDPATDPELAARYDAASPHGRAECRKHLLDALGLDAPEPGRLLGSLGRLALQKGWDVLADAIPALVERGAVLALVGDGDAALADRLATLTRRWPRRVALHVGWNEALARRLYAGVDGVLVPSRFEPCGLVQLQAQRYGALPVAHGVGGLLDTIVDGETGVLFAPLSVDALVGGAERAAELYRARGGALTRDLLGLDVSWREPAARWERLLLEVAAEASARL